MYQYVLMDSFYVIVAVILLYKIRLKKFSDFNDSYLSKKQTDTLKGMLAVGIFLHHFSGWFFKMSPACYLLSHMGSYMVSVFFFISGYGLIYGLSNKQNYTRRFPQNKLFTLILPYWICILVYSVWYLYKRNLDIKAFFLSFISQRDVVKYSWFIFAIVTMYAAFYIACIFSDKVLKNRKYVILIFALLQIMSLFFRFDWITSALNMTVGMLWFNYKEKIDSIVKKRYWLIMPINVILLFASALPKYLFAAENNVALMNVSDALAGIFFTVFVINLLRKVELNNIFSSYAGKISYEIYLLHGLAIEVAFAVAGRGNPLIFGLLSLALTIVLSIAVNALMSLVNKVRRT